MQSVTMAITGMTCGGCVNSVRKALASVPGVSDTIVSVGTAAVTYEPERTNPDALRRVIVQAGFGVAPA